MTRRVAAGGLLLLVAVALLLLLLSVSLVAAKDTVRQDARPIIHIFKRYLAKDFRDTPTFKKLAHSVKGYVFLSIHSNVCDLVALKT